MSSVILRTSARPILALMLAFSVYLLLRGHNAPGGGFIGGLFAASGLAVHAIAFGRRAAEAALRLSPRAVLGAGLLLAGASGLPALLLAEPFLTHLWWSALSTALVFDVGVYLTVVGSVCVFLFELTED